MNLLSRISGVPRNLPARLVALFLSRGLAALIALVCLTATPTLASAVTPMVVAGIAHTVALKSDGTVVAWGNNSYGQLGDGTTTDRWSPVAVQGLVGVVAVSAGWYHTVAVRSDGTVVAWGNNTSGQLGDGTQINRSSPVAVPGLTGVATVSAGASHTMALKSDGTVMAWGANSLGQLGDGTTTARSSPVQVAGLTGMVAVAAGENHSLAIKSGGSVWAWGNNSVGQLGDGTTTARTSPEQLLGLSSVAAIAAGSQYSIALKLDSSVWAWGINFYGQLGDGTTTNRSIPVAVQGLTGVIAVAAQSDNTMALKSGGTVMAWGSNGSGQLGDGTTTSRSIPVAVPGITGAVAVAAGVAYAAALKSDGTVVAWGNNSNGQLGDGTTTNRLSPVTVTYPVDIRSYIPAAKAINGYKGYLRVINTGTTATPVNVAVIDGATGVVGSSAQLVASLPTGAAVTFSAPEVEVALGTPLPANDRPRIRVTATGPIEVQSFMANPEGVVTQISGALTASTGYAVRSYVPAANAVGGYTGFIRVINIGTTASPIQATLIDDATGVAGASGQLTASLPAGAAVTFTAQQIEAALGASVNPASRPRISITAVSVPLEVQSFMANPSGTVTQIGDAQSGTSIAVRSFFPAANSSVGYTGYIRVINTGTTATPIIVSLIDGTTGQVTGSEPLTASLPAGAAKTFSAQQVEAALGISLPASARPRIRVTASVSIDVQSFVSNPSGTVTQIVGAQSGSSVDVRTYVPAVNAAGGYTSFIRLINTGTTTTAVSVAVIDGATGAVGASGQLTASLPTGAAVTFTAQQVEAALRQALPAGDRPRIRVTSSASTLDVQSFMSKPGGVLTETQDFQ
jgi:alpha-tubulin suppressor-like RCC1 family protein